jgi:hypothetical protein
VEANGPDVPVLYRVRVRTADGRELTSAPAVVMPDAQEAPKGEGQPAPQLYRFIARTADGKSYTSAIVLGAPAK